MSSSKIIRIVISGCCGRMGNRIASLALEDKNFFLAGAIENQEHPSIGRDFGEYLGSWKSGVIIGTDCRSSLENADILIEFSTPQATMLHLAECLDLKKSVVIGTTGLSDGDEKKIKAASRKIAIVKSSNMSLGVNLLFGILAETAKKMGSFYDIEIVEMHHNQKKDAPSGTALSMAEIICRAMGLDSKETIRFGRQGFVGARPKKEIGIHAVRAGEIVGEHTVLFAGKGECIELTHRAQSRDAFAKGALLAAQFLYGKKDGIYDMQGVLGLKEKNK